MDGKHRNNKSISSNSKPIELKFEESEEINKRLFKLIDQMHLQDLDLTMYDSSVKFKQIIKAMIETSESLKDQAQKLAADIFNQKQADEESELANQEAIREEKEYLTSFVIADTPGEQPKIMKRIVKNTEIDLAKLKELLKNQQLLVDSLKNSLREIVSKINPEALGALNVKGKQPLEELFELIFELLYGEEKDKFQWKNFKFTALLNEEGAADFLARMANFDMKELSEGQLEKVHKTKESNELRTYLEDPKVGEQLIEIADWLEYLFHGNTLVKELASIEELYAESKELVEIQERNQRKQAYIKGIKEQRITEHESQLEFMNFVADKLMLIKDNFSKTQQKIKAHVNYQSEVIATIIKYETHKQKGNLK